MVPPASVRVSRVPTYSGYRRRSSGFVYKAFTFFGLLSQNNSTTVPPLLTRSSTPKSTLFGLASFHFARRYYGNRFFFLFLPLLRCFSSRRSLRMAMDSPYGDRAFLCRVPPFGYLRIADCVRLPVAFRSFLRPSSVLDAKAFALCSY